MADYIKIYSFKDAFFTGNLPNILESIRNGIWSDIIWTITNEYERVVWIDWIQGVDKSLIEQSRYETECDLFYVLGAIDDQIVSMINFSMVHWELVINFDEDWIHFSNHIDKDLFFSKMLYQSLLYIKRGLWRNQTFFMKEKCKEYDNMFNSLLKEWVIASYSHSSEMLVDWLSFYDLSANSEDNIELFVNNSWSLCFFEESDLLYQDNLDEYNEEPFYIINLLNHESNRIN